MKDRNQPDVLIEVGRKGGYIPINSAGGPPPGDPELARHPQRVIDVPSSQPPPQAHTMPAPQ
ncbi:MAG: hypothetical protein ACRDG4_07900 [Chloroflexota bacterium]